MFPRRNRLTAAVLLTVLFAAWSTASAQSATQAYADGVEAYKQGNVESAKRDLALALEIDKNFRPTSALLGRINMDQRAGGAPGISVKALQTTIVPIEFRETTLASALEFVRQQADAVTGGKLKINFAVNLPPELANKRVTLKMDRVPVMEVLRYLGELSGVSFQVQKYAILVTPAAAAGASAPAPIASPTP